MNKEGISITIPALNEQATIEDVSRLAIEEVSKLTKKYELVLVNDGSTDRTGEIIKTLAREYKGKIKVIDLKNNIGFSGAMKVCYKNAKMDYIFLAPADGQFDFSELEKFVRKIKDNDIVTAYRIVNEESAIRKFNSFVFHLLARLFYGIKLKEFSSCVMYRKEVRDSIKITAKPESCLFLLEFIYKALKKGYRIGQVPIHFYKRKGGKAKGSDPKMIIRTLQEMVRFWFEIKTGKINAQTNE